MALARRDELLAAEWMRFREFTVAGRSEQVLQLAEQVIAESSDPFVVAQAHIERLAAHFNMRNTGALPTKLDEVEQHLKQAPHPRLIGEYHILAGAIAHDHGSYSVALLHLVKAERALDRMDERTLAAVDTWHDLAAIYSHLGYHVKAVQAGDRCRSVCSEAGLPPALGTAVIAYVHAAVHLDQRGDTTGCVRELTSIVERSRPIVADLAVFQQVLLRYAVRRLAVLDHPTSLEVPEAHDVDPILTQVNTLGDACDALAARKPHQALAILDAAPEPLSALGFAEPFRLRSLALSQVGDHAGALANERAVFRQTDNEERELRRLLDIGVNARIDQEQLRHSAEQHARAALADPLTGLPNRRKVDDFTAALIGKGQTAIIGLLDVDGFKAINDNHGHATGDIVLQRLAGVLAREVRPSDLPARHGGDEFLVVLPGTSKGEAEALGGRIEAAIRDEDWSSVVPDAPVAVSIGWAELDADADAAFRAADAALYRTKRQHHARR